MYKQQQCTPIIHYKGEITLAYTVEPPKRGQHGDEAFVLSREVVLFRRFLFLSLKRKHFSCLDTNTTNKRECNQLNHESVDVGSFCKRLP